MPIVDMSNRFRLLVNEVEAGAPLRDLPSCLLPYYGNHILMKTGCVAWIYAGGAHHTGYSQNLTTEHMEDFAAMANIEFVLIGKNTSLYQFKNDLGWSDLYYQINK